MPYIVISLEGQASAGGFLKVDGGAQIALSDDLMIKVSEGTHYLEFSSQSSAQRGLSRLNAAVGNDSIAAWSERNAVDGKISETFSKNSAMLFKVISDSRGHILDLPTYSMKELTDEDYEDMNRMYEKRLAEEALAEKKSAGTEFLLCLILGWMGVHKFYRGQIGGGLLYLVTFGLFGFGWLGDTIRLLFKWIKSKK